MLRTGAACGSAERHGDAHPRHRARHLLGQPLAQHLEQRPDVEVVVGVDTRDPRCRSSAPSSCGPTRRTRSSSASCGRRRSTPSCTPTSIVDSTRASSRTLHEVNVIGTMNLLAAAGARREPGAQGRAQDLDARLRLELRRPVPLPRGHRVAPAHRAPTSSGRCSRSTRSCATSPRTTRTCRSRCCGSPTCSATTSTPRSPRMLRLPVVPEIFGFDPAAAVRARGRRASARSCTRRHRRPGVFNVAGDGHLPWSEVCRASSASARLADAAVLTDCGREPLRLLRIVDIPPEVLSLLRYGRGVDNDAFSRRRVRLRLHDARHRRGVRTGATVRARRRRLRPEYEYEHDVEDFFRNSPRRGAPRHLIRRGEPATCAGGHAENGGIAS